MSHHLVENLVGAAATGLLILGSSMIDVSDPVVVASGGTMLAAITGALKVLWDRNTKLSASTEIALTKCEEEHKRASAKYEEDRKVTADHMSVLVQQVISLTGDVGLMKGRIQGFQEATEKSEAIAARDHAEHQQGKA